MPPGVAPGSSYTLPTDHRCCSGAQSSTKQRHSCSDTFKISNKDEKHGTCERVDSTSHQGALEASSDIAADIQRSRPGERKLDARAADRQRMSLGVKPRNLQTSSDPRSAPASKLRMCSRAPHRLILAVLSDGSPTHPRSPRRAEDDGSGLSKWSMPSEACRLQAGVNRPLRIRCSHRISHQPNHLGRFWLVWVQKSLTFASKSICG